MSMPFEFNFLIVTNEKAIRKENNTFSLELNGYHLFPIDTPINVTRKNDEKPFGIAVIRKIEWKSESTYMEYELKAIDTVN
ncbi:DUF2584 family protein [Gottfriedia sp. NPDC056225]|uniref:DUF2584 family protein n=1 Tax=Gottfriedia sp. NPDC056225 TaxID=3345751 RepID=UPI001559EA92|nr:DUF2584 family protein [Arthrobacter citreus]